MQRELTYGEDLELRPVLKVIAEKFGAGSPSLGDVIDTIFDGNTLPVFIGIVLKPHEPTLLHKAYNAINAKLHRVDRGKIVQQMPNSQLAEVLADFFMLNTGWMKSLPTLQNLSALNSNQ